MQGDTGLGRTVQAVVTPAARGVDARTHTRMHAHAVAQDDMGLGKTVQAVVTSAAWGVEAWPLLIVCPSAMRCVCVCVCEVVFACVWRRGAAHCVPVCHEVCRCACVKVAGVCARACVCV